MTSKHAALQNAIDMQCEQRVEDLLCETPALAHALLGPRQQPPLLYFLTTKDLGMFGDGEGAIERTFRALLNGGCSLSAVHAGEDALGAVFAAQKMGLIEAVRRHGALSGVPWSMDEDGLGREMFHMFLHQPYFDEHFAAQWGRFVLENMSEVRANLPHLIGCIAQSARESLDKNVALDALLATWSDLGDCLTTFELDTLLDADLFAGVRQVRQRNLHAFEGGESLRKCHVSMLSALVDHRVPDAQLQSHWQQLRLSHGTAAPQASSSRVRL